ncbi:MAG: arginase family protein [Candidatus Thorarchaeota archaeon]
MSFFNFGDEINKETQFVIFGIPWDYLTSTDLPNSSIAPEDIRKITDDIGFTTELGFQIPKFFAADMGNIEIEPMKIELNLENIQKFIKKLYKQNDKIIPVMIGGDHFCSYPVLKAIGDRIENKEEFGVLVFDAHLDFYQEWDKGVYSHATISHRIFDLDYINNKNILIVGTRDIDIEELELASTEKIKNINAYHLIEGADYFIEKIKQFFLNSNIKNLYVSIDIDALDPSIAPGTGYAIPGGFSYRDIWKILKEISLNFNVVGFDLVEVAPNLDLGNKMTIILAAKLIVEFMDFIRRRKV